MLSTHPSVNVVVGSGGTVGWPGEQVVLTSGQAQISVLCGLIVVTTVAVGEHQCSPGRLVCLARTPPCALVHVGQLSQPGLSNTSRVAVHAPDGATVLVTGGFGVGPVGSPDEQLEVGTMQTGRQWTASSVVVMVATGVLQGLSSPGSVPKFVGEEFGTARELVEVSFSRSKKKKKCP